MSEADMALSLKDITPGEGNKAMLKAARDLSADWYGWLYLYGGPGNAKTITLKALVNAANQAGRGPAMYVKFADVVNWMRDSFSERQARALDPFANMGYVERFERLKQIPVLAIDEMGKERSNEFADEFRFHFLDERYQQGITGQTVTIFASNDDPAGLASPLWDRIRDGRFRVAEVTAASARRWMKRGQP